MKKEEKKQLFERIEKRTKEFFGQYSPNGGKTIDEYLARCKEADLNVPEPEPETSNADDLPF